MHICDKLLMNKKGLEENGPITIVAFGDSVTHGALANDEVDYETVYWNLLKKKIYDVRNYVPINVINAGIGGDNATNALKRIDKHVLAHNPDLIIICFGLNELGNVNESINSLRIIFEKSKQSGAQVIYMTPNMFNTYVDEENTENRYIEYAAVTAKWQNDGTMDKYIKAAVSLAGEMQVQVCDCYAKWKEISKTQDTTQLLANRINHPTRKMHELFAESLFEIIFKDLSMDIPENSSTMKGEN